MNNIIVSNKILKQRNIIVVLMILLLTILSTNSIKASSTDYWINDNSYNLETYLKQRNNEEAIYINANLTSVGDLKIDSTYKSITGWEKNFMYNEEKTRHIGFQNDDVITFVKGANIKVNSINFSKRSNAKIKILIEDGATVHFKNTVFSDTIVNYGNATFEDTAFESGKIDNKGTASYLGSTVEPENIAKAPYPEANDKEFWINDSSFDLENYLNQRNNAGVIYINSNFTTVGEVKIDSTYKSITGWDKGLTTNQEKIRQVGNQDPGTITFVKGANVKINSLSFFKRNHATAQGAKIVIEEGASVHFNKTSFSNTIVNNGSATFEDSLFVTNQIENNGTATYIGSTIKPENIGNENPGLVDLGIKLKTTDIKDAVQSDLYSQDIAFEVYGTNADKSNVDVSFNESNGLNATINNGLLSINGTPTKSGEMIFIISAQSGNTKTTTSITINVLSPLKVIIQDSFPTTMVADPSNNTRVDSMARATGGGSGGGDGSSYTASGKVYIIEGNKEKVDFNDYRTKNKDAKINVTISPEGSGLNGTYVYDSLSIYGTPNKKGKFYVEVKVTDGNRTAKSNKSVINVLQDDTSFQTILDGLDKSISTWDIEPFTISKINHTKIPSNLTKLIGSRQSGVYAVLGNNKSFGTESITIPKGSNITLENVKIYSSVKLIVEKGATLQVRGSAIYGTTEVNGGTLIMNDSYIINSLTLNNGSTLKDSAIKSTRLLTDDSIHAYDTKVSVYVNGNVNVQGTNSITSAGGDATKAGQTALYVNGTLSIAKESSLVAQGGIGEIYSLRKGGDGIFLNNGRINGDGYLEALGGSNYESNGGAGIEGKGVISVATLKATGGNSLSIMNKPKNGGDAIGKNVIITTKVYDLAGGKGSIYGSDKVTLTKEPVKVVICKNISKGSTIYKYKKISGKCFNYQTVTSTVSSIKTYNYSSINNKKIKKSASIIVKKKRKIVQKDYYKYNNYGKLTSKNIYKLSNKNKFVNTYKRTVSYHSNKRVKINKVVAKNLSNKYTKISSYQYTTKSTKQKVIKLSYKKGLRNKRTEYIYNKKGKLQSNKYGNSYRYITTYKKGKAKVSTKAKYSKKGKLQKAKKSKIRSFI